MRNTLLILILLAICLTPNRSSAQVVLKTDTIDIACGSNNVFLVPIRVRNFTDVAALQFTFQWNAADLAYQFITDINPNFTGIAFDSTTLINQGKFTFAWSQLNSLSLPDDEIVLNVAFKRIGGPASTLQFTDDPTAIFAFDSGFNDLPITTAPGLVRPQDSAPPTITCPASLTVQSIGPAVVNGIAPVATDDCGTPTTGWTSTGATNASFPADPDASGASFNLGTSQVTYTATDIANHTATCSFNVTVQFAIGDDLTFLPVAPSVSCGQTISIDVTTYNFDTIAAFQYSMGWDSTLLQFDSVSNFNPVLNLTMANFGTSQTGSGIFSIGWDGPLSGTNLPDSTVLFTLTFHVLGSTMLNFTDNPTTRTAFVGPNFPPVEVPVVTINIPVTVIDTLPPTITCPADVSVQAPGSIAVQNIAPQTLDDNCAGPITGWTSTGATIAADSSDADASGTVFNQGNSTVTYTVTDAGGNTATCSFNVSVEFGAGTTDLTLFAGNVNASCNGTFSMDVTVLNFDSIAGLQFSMGWDTLAMHYTSVSNFNPLLSLTSANFGEMFTNIGQFSFGWTGPLSGLTLNDGDVLFTLNFSLTPTSNGGLVDFTDIPTTRQAFSGTAFPPVDIPVMTFGGQVTVFDSMPPTITCPANVSVMAPTGSITADITGLDPLALQDSCTANPTLSYAQTGATGNSGAGNANGTYNAGTTTVTYTATDDAGNTATCSFTVTVDAGTPVILNSGSINAGCQGATQVQNCITVNNFTDIIGLQFGLSWDSTVLRLVPPVDSIYPGFTVNGGSFFNYSTANDGLLLFFAGSQTWPDIPSGDTLFCLTFDVLNPNDSTAFTFEPPVNAVNSSFSQVPVTTNNGSFSSTADNVPPAVTCPPDQMVAPPPTECSANFDPPLPTATDACGTVDTIFRVPAGNIFTGVTAVTYTVSDQAGNTTTCSFNVIVTDTVPPQMFNCPPNITVDLPAGDCFAPGNWAPPLFNDCSAVTVTSNFTPTDLLSSCSPNTIVYQATDSSGNTTTCQFNVLVRDTTPPSIVCPPDTTLYPISSCDTTVTFPMATATDACDISVDIACNATPGDVFPAGQTTVTCVAFDDCDNVAQCTFIISVVDAAPPTIYNCPTDTVVVSPPGTCGANVSWIVPTADDVCDPLVTLTSTDTSGTFFGAGAPIVVTYTAMDDSGNSATCTFNVTVQDTVAPLLTGCPQAPFLISLPLTDCDTVLTWTPPVAADNCGLVDLISNFDPGYNFPTGDTMVVYTATDQSGNTATCAFQVVVRDNIPPEIMGCPADPAPVDANGACTAQVFWDEPTATDNCSVPTLTAQYHSGDEFPIGVTMVQIIAQDASNNYDTCAFTVTVLGVPPGFDLSTVPQNVTTNTACDTTLSWNLPTAVGFCNPPTVTSDSISPATFGQGVHVVTFTATDGTSTATATFTVTVSEQVAPVMICPSDSVVVNTSGIILSGAGLVTSADTAAGCLGAELTFDLPQATDNCMPQPTVTQTAGPVSGGVFPLGISTLTFQAADLSGNTAECSVSVFIVPAAGVNPLADPNPGCANEMVTITAESVPGATYVWAHLPEGVLPSTTNEYVISSLDAETDGVYAVSALINGCPTLPDSVNVTLIAAPQPENDQFFIDAGAVDTFNVFLNDSINPEDYEICQTLPDPLPAGLVYLGGGAFAYQDQSGKEVSFSYQICYCGEPGEMATATIYVNDSECSFIPNIITPNGDDINDWFTIPCLNGRTHPDNSLTIYNQWGDKVFEDKGYTNDPNDATHPAWRGTLDGKPGKNLPDGVYYYIFQPGPSEKVIKGFVEIFR